MISNTDVSVQTVLAVIDNLNKIIKERDEEIAQLKQTIKQLEEETQLAYDNN